jgi:hypothetical protein
MGSLGYKRKGRLKLGPQVHSTNLILTFRALRKAWQWLPKVETCSLKQDNVFSLVVLDGLCKYTIKTAYNTLEHVLDIFHLVPCEFHVCEQHSASTTAPPHALKYVFNCIVFLQLVWGKKHKLCLFMWWHWICKLITQFSLFLLLNAPHDWSSYDLL